MQWFLRITLYLLVFDISLVVAESEVKEKFISSEIVPYTIRRTPEELCVVNYTKSGKVVKIGELLRNNETTEEPFIKFDFESPYFYTIVLTDPDAPTPQLPILREYIHWLVVNMQGGSGDPLVVYQGPKPPSAAAHRYIVLVYLQPGYQVFDEPSITNQTLDAFRYGFKVQRFVDKYNLIGPLCGTFFYEKYNY